jgi:hypothetical protein
MRKNAPEYTKDHTYLHKREAERTQGLHKLTWTGMGWTGCGRAIRRAIRAPCALELAKDNPLDAGYIKAKADAEKMFKKECAKLRKKEKEALGKALSAKCQEVEDMGLHSDALVFLRIQVHSDAFTHTRIH